MNRWTKLILVAVAIGLLVGGSIKWYSEKQQSDRKQLVESQIAKIRPILNGDTRFADVELMFNTALGGHLRVAGTVKSAADRGDLESLIKSTSPAFPVVWRVQISPPASSTSRISASSSNVGLLPASSNRLE